MSSNVLLSHVAYVIFICYKVLPEVRDTRPFLLVTPNCCIGMAISNLGNPFAATVAHLNRNCGINTLSAIQSAVSYPFARRNMRFKSMHQLCVFFLNYNACYLLRVSSNRVSSLHQHIFSLFWITGGQITNRTRTFRVLTLSK